MSSSIHPLQGTGPSQFVRPPTTGFEQVLQDKLQEDPLTISQHAQKRMVERNIQLDEGDKIALSQAVTEMISKGSRACLIMYKETGFIASLPQRTIVTAIERLELNDITNIDSVKFIH